MYSVVLCKFLVCFGKKKNGHSMTDFSIVCTTSFLRDDNRTPPGWCGFFLGATGAPSIPIYLLADGWCHSQLNKYCNEPLSLASVRYGPATRSHLISVTADTGVLAEPSTTCCLLKAMQFSVHPNHLSLRVSSTIVTSPQK